MECCGRSCGSCAKSSKRRFPGDFTPSVRSAPYVTPQPPQSWTSCTVASLQFTVPKARPKRFRSPSGRVLAAESKIGQTGQNAVGWLRFTSMPRAGTLPSITGTKVFSKSNLCVSGMSFTGSRFSCLDGDCAGVGRPARMLRSCSLEGVEQKLLPLPAASVFQSVFSFHEGAQRSSAHERSVFRGARGKFSVRSREESLALQSRAHRLRLRIQLERIFAHLASPAGLFVAPEGKSGVENVVAVNPHGSRAQG